MTANVMRKRMLLHPRHLAAVATVSFLGALGACETQQQRITGREDKLSAAGFLIRPANIPEREAMLARLPANKFVRRTSGDSVHYVYADPLRGGVFVLSMESDHQTCANCPWGSPQGYT